MSNLSSSETSVIVGAFSADSFRVLLATLLRSVNCRKAEGLSGLGVLDIRHTRPNLETSNYFSASFVLPRGIVGAAVAFAEGEYCAPICGADVSGAWQLAAGWPLVAETVKLQKSALVFVELGSEGLTINGLPFAYRLRTDRDAIQTSAVETAEAARLTCKALGAARADRSAADNAWDELGRELYGARGWAVKGISRRELTTEESTRIDEAAALLAACRAAYKALESADHDANAAASRAGNAVRLLALLDEGAALVSEAVHLSDGPGGPVVSKLLKPMAEAVRKDRQGAMGLVWSDGTRVLASDGYTVRALDHVAPAGSWDAGAVKLACAAAGASKGVELLEGGWLRWNNGACLVKGSTYDGGEIPGFGRVLDTVYPVQASFSLSVHTAKRLTRLMKLAEYGGLASDGLRLTSDHFNAAEGWTDPRTSGHAAEAFSGDVAAGDFYPLFKNEPSKELLALLSGGGDFQILKPSAGSLWLERVECGGRITLANYSTEDYRDDWRGHLSAYPLAVKPEGWAHFAEAYPVPETEAEAEAEAEALVVPAPAPAEVETVPETEAVPEVDNGARFSRPAVGAGGVTARRWAGAVRSPDLIRLGGVREAARAAGIVYGAALADLRAVRPEARGHLLGASWADLGGAVVLVSRLAGIAGRIDRAALDLHAAGFPAGAVRWRGVAAGLRRAGVALLHLHAGAVQAAAEVETVPELDNGGPLAGLASGLNLGMVGSYVYWPSLGLLARDSAEVAGALRCGEAGDLWRAGWARVFVATLGAIRARRDAARVNAPAPCPPPAGPRRGGPGLAAVRRAALDLGARVSAGGAVDNFSALDLGAGAGAVDNLGPVLPVPALPSDPGAALAGPVGTGGEAPNRALQCPKKLAGVPTGAASVPVSNPETGAVESGQQRTVRTGQQTYRVSLGAGGVASIVILSGRAGVPEQVLTGAVDPRGVLHGAVAWPDMGGAMPHIRAALADMSGIRR